MGAGSSVGKSDEIVHQSYHRKMSKVLAEEFRVLQAEQEKKEGEGFSGVALEARFEALLRNKEREIREEVIRQVTNDFGVSQKIRTNVAEIQASTPFKRMTEATIQNLRMRNQYSFLVGVDGSAAGDLAFQVAMGLRKRIDELVIFHNYNPDEEAQKALPADYKKAFIESKYEAQCAGSLPASCYQLYFRERDVDQAPKECLLQLIAEYEERASNTALSMSSKGVRDDPFFYLPSVKIPDFFVLGWTGKRSRQAKGEFAVMGSVTDIALRQVHMPCIVAKQPPKPKGESNVFAFCVDETEKSKDGLCIMLTLVKPRDTVVLVHVCDSSRDASEADPEGEETMRRIKEFYEKELELLAPVGSRLDMIPLDGTNDLSSTLITYFNDVVCPDYLALAPRVPDQDQFARSSLTEALVVKTTCNLIFAKMPNKK